MVAALIMIVADVLVTVREWVNLFTEGVFPGSNRKVDVFLGQQTRNIRVKTSDCTCKI